MSARSAGPFSDPTANASALVTRIAIALLLIVAPLASVATRQAIYALVPIGVALTLVAWLLEPGTRGPRQLRDALLSQSGLAAIFLVAWTALSLTWTPFAIGPSERFVKSTTTIGLVAVAIALLPERTKTSNLYLLPIGEGVGAIAMIVAGIRLIGTHHLPNPEFSILDRSALGLSLLLWPAIGGLLIREKEKAAISLAVLAASAVIAVGLPLAILALFAGGAVVAFALKGSHSIGGRLARSSAALIVASPLLAWLMHAIVPVRLTPDFALPIVAWAEMISKDGVRVLLGHGFDSATLGIAAGFLPLRSPHSILFEIWFELGIVGAAAAAFVTYRAFIIASEAPALMAPSLLAGLAAAFIIACFGVGIAPVWWITLLALDAFAFALVRKGHFRNRRPGVADIARASGHPTT